MAERSGRPIFSSTPVAILATAGVAIGLGNIWRFPYMMGKFGGSAFLILYVVLLIAFGIPALMAEFALGRQTRMGPHAALKSAGLPGARWFSLLLLLTVLMGASYYGFVLALVLGEAITFGTSAIDSNAGSAVREELPGRMVRIGLVLVTVMCASTVVGLGVRRGIQRLSTIGLPLFFLMFIVLIVRVLTLDGAMDGLKVFLTPDPAQFTASTGFAAMGQVFFSLGLGGTFMVVYATYLRRDESIPALAIGTTVADLGAALMAGLIVVPAAIAVGLDLTKGPLLLFETMPEVFRQLPLGDLFGAVFFACVFLIGLLSLIAAYEVLIAASGDLLGWSRRRSVIILGSIQLLLGVPALFAEKYIEYSDLIWGTTMQPLGSVAVLLALGWCVGRTRALEEIARNSRLPVPTLLFYWIKYAMPAAILTTLVYGWVVYLTRDSDQDPEVPTENINPAESDEAESAEDEITIVGEAWRLPSGYNLYEGGRISL